MIRQTLKTNPTVRDVQGTPRLDPSRRRVLAMASGLISAVSLAGCTSTANNKAPDENHDNAGNETHDHDEGPPDGPVNHAEVAMLSDETGHYFDPHLVWVTKGGTVTWTNESGAHTTTAHHPDVNKPSRIPEDAASWDSGMFSEQGATFEYTFEVEGVYDYFCIPHEYRGMVGSVIVGHPETQEQPGLAPPQDSLPADAQAVIETLNEQTTTALEQRQ